MIEESEAITLIVSVGILILSLSRPQALASIERAGLLVAGFIALTAGWALTVIEGLVWPQLSNTLEHLAYLTGTTLLTIWIWPQLSRRGPHVD